LRAKTAATLKKQGVVTAPNFEDYQQVYNAIAKKLEEHDEYEDGSYGPVICGWAGMLAGRMWSLEQELYILRDDLAD